MCHKCHLTSTAPYFSMTLFYNDTYQNRKCHCSDIDVYKCKS